MIGKGRNTVPHHESCARRAARASIVCRKARIEAGDDRPKQEETVDHTSGLTRRQALQASAGALALTIGTGVASAQAAYPARPVKVVIPYPPAAAPTPWAASCSRSSARCGASHSSSTTAAAPAARSARRSRRKRIRDGYTILYDATAHSVNPALYRQAAVRHGQGLPADVPGLAGAQPPGGDAIGARRTPSPTSIALAKATPGGLDFGLVGQRHAAAPGARNVRAPRSASSSITSPIAAAGRRSTT